MSRTLRADAASREEAQDGHYGSNEQMDEGSPGSDGAWRMSLPPPPTAAELANMGVLPVT